MPVAFDVKVKMLHELNVVHELLLAQLTLEGHVRLELGYQHVRLTLDNTLVSAIRYIIKYLKNH